LEKFEIDINFFGSPESTRLEYKYSSNELCPHYVDVYYFEEGEWLMEGRVYYYPSGTSALTEIHVPQWSAYPNPANEGIWIEATIGSQVQISTIHGNIIFNGIIKSEKEYFRLHQTSTQLILTIINNSFISSRLITVSK
jgi:beta-glucanase (GH16 family)